MDLMNTENNKLILEENLDKKIFNIGKPLFIDQLIYPLLAILESLFISKLSGIDKLVIQTLGDQLFGVFINFFSFIPPILLPLISKISDNDHRTDKNLIDITFNSIIISLLVGITVTLLVISNIKFILYSGYLISYSKINDNIRDGLESYFIIKFLSFPLCLYNDVLYTILKGNMNFNLLVKSNLVCNLIYIIFTPFCIKYYGLLGINILCIFTDLIKTLIFTYKLIKLVGKENIYTYIINVYTYPKVFIVRLINKFYYFFNNGIFIQLKNIVNKTTFMKINTKILSLDSNGSLLGTYIMLCKFYDLFHLFFKSLNSVSTVLIPKIINSINKVDSTNKLTCTIDITINRINYWMNKIGFYQLITCLFNLLFIHLLNKDCFGNNKLIKYIKSFGLILNTSATTLLIISLTCYMNGLVNFYEILLQSNSKYKVHSIISVFFSIIMFLTIPYYNNLMIVWGTSLFLSTSKFILVKYYYESTS